MNIGMRLQRTASGLKDFQITEIGERLMEYLILIGIILLIPLQSVMIKQNDKRGAKNAGLWFTAATAFFAMVVFIVAEGTSFSFSWNFVPYSVGFALSYGVTFICNILALSSGPMSLTLLLQSYSLLLPAFYGILFLDEEIGVTLIIGIALLALCLFLTYFEKKGESERISVRWLIFALLAFLGNGMCSVIQKMHTTSLGDKYSNEFMIVALALITVSFACIALFRQRREFKPFIRRGWYFGALCGLFNGGVNMGVIMLSSMMPASLQFPMISGGSILATALFSVFLYKEKLTVRQWCGFGVGILSVILLNL